MTKRWSFLLYLPNGYFFYFFIYFFFLLARFRLYLYLCACACAGFMNLSSVYQLLLWEICWLVCVGGCFGLYSGAWLR